jgi:hypothetical protein
MDRLLFLVAKDQPDLWDQLSKEFSGKDVSVVVDRRRSERRRLAAARREERRQQQRRSHTDIDREVSARGFSVIRIEGDLRDVRRQGNPNAVRAVQTYIQERFRHYTTVSSWDLRRDGQSFVIFSRAGRPAHRILFDREFLDYYGQSMPDQIPRILDEWKLSSHLETAGSQLMVITTYGIRVEES